MEGKHNHLLCNLRKEEKYALSKIKMVKGYSKMSILQVNRQLI